MVQIHSAAVVDPGAKVGDFTSVWHLCHIESSAVVRENCNLGQNVCVGNCCRLGNSVSIFSHVELSDFVFCAPFMVFTHISFPRAVVNRQATFDKTLVEVGATLGANSTVVSGITVASGTILAAGSTLTRDSKAWSLMIGSPARQVGWVSAFGEKIPLPLEGDGQWCCPHTGDEYRLVAITILRVPSIHDILKYVPDKKLERVQYTGVTAEMPADHNLMRTMG